jgi:hypothetical protein
VAREEEEAELGPRNLRADALDGGVELRAGGVLEEVDLEAHVGQRRRDRAGVVDRVVEAGHARALVVGNADHQRPALPLLRAGAQGDKQHQERGEQNLDEALGRTGGQRATPLPSRRRTTGLIP